MRHSAFLCLCVLLPAAPANAADSMTNSSRTTDGKSASASSAKSINRDDPRDIARRLPVMPAAQANAIALQRVPGKLLHAEIETNDGIRTWQIDIQARDGHTVRMWLNANTGAFLKMVDR
jgi:uncharacterized membrane protein YkoI